MLGAGTFDACNVAGLASASTPGITAVAVNTLATGAFSIDGASLPVILLGYARGAEAVRVVTAVGMFGARAAATRASAIALVRAAGN